LMEVPTTPTPHTPYPWTFHYPCLHTPLHAFAASPTAALHYRTAPPTYTPSQQLPDGGMLCWRTSRRWVWVCFWFSHRVTPSVRFPSRCISSRHYLPPGGLALYGRRFSTARHATTTCFATTLPLPSDGSATRPLPAGWFCRVGDTVGSSPSYLKRAAHHTTTRFPGRSLRGVV